MAETALANERAHPGTEEEPPLRVLTHPFAVALGLTNLYLLALTGPLISTGHELVYHLTGSARVIFIPVMVDVVVLFLLLAGLLTLAERGGRLRVAIWSATVLALPWILTETISGFLGAVVPGWVSLLMGLSYGLGVAAITWNWKRILSSFDAVQPIIATILGVFALGGLMIFAQLAWFGWQARHLNPSPLLHHRQVATGPVQPRILWILLDELSYQQVYEQRFPGLKLPAFDQLAAESTVFTNVVPTGEYTRYVIPSLLTGVPADGVNVSGAGLLVAMHDTASGKWDRFQQHKTVFQDAIDAGYSTGVAGWYNPYCRILPAVLDHCYWMYHEMTPDNLSPDGSDAANLLTPVRTLLFETKHLLGKREGPPSDDLLDLQMHTADYRGLLTAGDAYLSNPSVGFLLLHMPVPHPFGFYDRKHQSFADHHTSYIDNLALADRYLAHVRALLEKEGQWDSTTVVVMGDHSWRTRQIWASTEDWSAEDQAASHGGKFDDRPAYLVKLPHQQTGARIDARFGAIRTRALFDAMLQKKVQTPEELRAWVGQR